ncbi:hypothetical protein Tco_1057627 [Tanacetum coccineum]|uniref:Myb-like domain-containing protein n=1 Tax=Tanacetum coccineum TaxID=301880 RepID=A0ABQ5H613_9ASTR
MLNDPTNQIPGSSSNPGSSTQPSFNQMPYYPNYQPQFATQEELLMFQQFKMQQMHQQQPQQLPNQFTTSQSHSEQQSHHLGTSKPSRGGRMKSMSKKNKEKEPQVEKQKRVRNAWTQDEELLLAECFIQVSEDPKTGCDQKRDTFWYKKPNGVQKGSEEKRLHPEHNDNYDPRFDLQRRSRLLGTDEEPKHFGDDELPRPPGLQRLAKSQRTGSNSTASSGSNPAAYQEFMAEQYELDRKAKMTATRFPGGQINVTEFWCHKISGAKLSFADVTPFFEFGTTTPNALRPDDDT